MYVVYVRTYNHWHAQRHQTNANYGNLMSDKVERVTKKLMVKPVSLNKFFIT